MIIVKIELHSAVTGQVTELGRLHITNDGTGTRERGNYDVERFTKSGGRRVLSRGRVENHPRLRMSVFALLCKAVDALRRRVPK